MNALTNPDLIIFIKNFLLTIGISIIISIVFSRYGNSLNNRSSLAKNFLILGVTTNLMIVVVKQSLELSLGLIGALSIVRFRTAIKDPEELTYVFLVIASGVGMGANKPIIVMVSLTLLIPLIIIYNKFNKSKNDYDDGIYVAITSTNTILTTDSICNILNKFTKKNIINRTENSKNGIEVQALVVFNQKNSINNINLEILKLDPESKISTFNSMI